MAGLLKYFRHESKQNYQYCLIRKVEGTISSIELMNNTSCHDILDGRQRHVENVGSLHSSYIHGSHAPWSARKMYPSGPSVILTLALNELIIQAPP